MVPLPSHHAELARQFEQGRSRVEFLGLMRELQTKLGVVPAFLGSWHGGAPPRKRPRGSRRSGYFLEEAAGCVGPAQLTHLCHRRPILLWCTGALWQVPARRAPTPGGSGRLRH